MHISGSQNLIQTCRGLPVLRKCGLPPSTVLWIDCCTVLCPWLLPGVSCKSLWASCSDLLSHFRLLQLFPRPSFDGCLIEHASSKKQGVMAHGVPYLVRNLTATTRVHGPLLVILMQRIDVREAAVCVSLLSAISVHCAFLLRYHPLHGRDGRMCGRRAP